MPLAAPVSTPPLLEGDSQTSEEFLRRWEQMPDVRRAELIDGIVFIPSPISRDHDAFRAFFAAWLSLYATATPGCYPGLDATWRMGDRQVPQPDAVLVILPEYGGQSKIAGDYYSGAPELIVEVAVSSHSRDFGAKKRLYEQMGVREYLIAVPREERLVSLALTPEGYRPQEADSDGAFRSICFPGLQLDFRALWRLDLQRMNSVLQQGLATAEHADFAAHLAAKKL